MPNTTVSHPFEDFHLLVNKVAGAEDVGFVTVVVGAPVSLWGYRFDRLGSGKSLDDVLEACTGERPSRDVGGTLRLRWREPQQPRAVPPTGKVGQMLFETLFPEGSTAYELLGRSCEFVNEKGRILRLKLELHPELSNLPWEVIQCPLSSRLAQLIAQRKMPVIRYLGDIRHRPPGPSAANGKPCVLVVKADPEDLSDRDIALSFFGERNRIVNALEDLSERASLEVIESPRDRSRGPQVSTLQRLIERVDQLEQEGRSLIGLHFIGHGGIDDDGSFLYGENAEGFSERIGAHELCQALEPAEALRWVILNACNAGYEPVGCPLAGLATSMALLKNVPTVIAYKRLVETNDAEKLAGEFYDQVMGRGRSPEEVVRNIQFKYNNPGGLVLLVRSVRGKTLPLFDLPEETPERVQHQVRPEPEGAEQAAPQPPPRPRPRRAEARPPESGDLGELVLIKDGPFKKGLTPDQVEHLLEQFREHNLPLDLESVREVLQEEPCEVVSLPDFYIDRTPVTNWQFARFIDTTGYRTEAERKGASRTWRLHDTPEKADHPVVFVSYGDAEAYCRWAGKRLPTADEWKKAHRGPEGRLYPWGDIFDKDLCNTAESHQGWQTTPVTLLPDGASVYGCLDMVGNVEEWTATPARRGGRLILGGSWCSTCEVYGLPVLHRVASPSFNSNEQGFRCAKDA